MTRTATYQHAFGIRHDGSSHWAACLLDGCPWCGPRVLDPKVAGYSGAAHRRIRTRIDPIDPTL